MRAARTLSDSADVCKFQTAIFETNKAGLVARGNYQRPGTESFSSIMRLVMVATDGK